MSKESTDLLYFQSVRGRTARQPLMGQGAALFIAIAESSEWMSVGATSH